VLVCKQNETRKQNKGILQEVERLNQKSASRVAHEVLTDFQLKVLGGKEEKDTQRKLDFNEMKSECFATKMKMKKLSSSKEVVFQKREMHHPHVTSSSEHSKKMMSESHLFIFLSSSILL
jgi:hypothetical protein